MTNRRDGNPLSSRRFLGESTPPKYLPASSVAVLPRPWLSSSVAVYSRRIAHQSVHQCRDHFVRPCPLHRVTRFPSFPCVVVLCVPPVQRGPMCCRPTHLGLWINVPPYARVYRRCHAWPRGEQDFGQSALTPPIYHIISSSAMFVPRQHQASGGDRSPKPAQSSSQCLLAINAI